MYANIKAQFPEDCKNLDFQFVKNCYGTLIIPKLATGVRVDGNILLKSIAPSGAVYVRLFSDDNDDDADDDVADSVFDFGPFDRASQRNSSEADQDTAVVTIDLSDAEEEFKEMNEITNEVVEQYKDNQNPVEIL